MVVVTLQRVDLRSGVGNMLLFAAFFMKYGDYGEFYLDNGAYCHLCVDNKMFLK